MIFSDLVGSFSCFFLGSIYLKTYDPVLGGTFYMEGCLTFGRKLGHVELIYKYSVCICIIYIYI